MKTTLRYLAMVALGIVAVTWPSLKVSATEEGGEDVAAREAYRRLQLQDENGQIPLDGWSNASRQKEAMRFLPEAWSEFSSPAQIEAGIAGGIWTSIGPGNIGGRIRSIVIQLPGSQFSPRTMWVGGVAGGVWKTTDGGGTWTTNTDRLANLAVNCMAIDPVYHPPNQEVLYAGTGEGFGNEDGVTGNGIYKTTDGGTTWIRLPSPNNDPDFAWINRLAISPNNLQLLLAAVRVYPPQGGVYGKILRSTNGGTTWTTALTLSGDPMTDVRFKPISTEAPIPDTPLINCLASSSNGAVYYSTDDGATWITSLGLPPPDRFQRVELAYSRSTPLIVYASKATSEHGNPAAVYRSINGGYTFSSTGLLPPSARDHGAFWYANVLWVDPTNSQIVLVGGESLHRSTDSGGTWVQVSNQFGGSHPDHHAIVEDPLYNGMGNKTVYGGNDGGIYKTEDVLAGSPPVSLISWTSLNHRLGVTQFYGAAGHAGYGTIIGGTQDNGTVQYSGAFGDPEGWSVMSPWFISGDGGLCAVDQQLVTPYFYGEGYRLQIYRNKNGGLAPSENIWGGPNGIPGDCFGLPCANFTAPFILDPNNTQDGVHIMLAGGKSLWRSTSARDDNPNQVRWDEIKQPTGGAKNYINAIAVAEGNSNLIWVGYNDGSVYYTTNAPTGPSPSPTPTWNPGDPNNLLPGGQPSIDERFCTRITIAQALPGNPPDVARTVYATFAGFFPSTTDTRGNVWKRDNNGAWTDIHNNLPSTPIYSLVISPSNPNFLYIGTEVGVFASANGGETWSPAFGGSSADTLVYSLIVSASTPSSPDIVYAATEVGVFGSKDNGATWSPGFGGPANTRVAELFWMPTMGSRKLVVATHGRGMFTLQPAGL